MFIDGDNEIVAEVLQELTGKYIYISLCKYYAINPIILFMLKPICLITGSQVEREFSACAVGPILLHIGSEETIGTSLCV